MKNGDIADTEIIIRDTSAQQNIIFRQTVPYFKRILEIDSSKDFDRKLKTDSAYQICILAKDSKDIIKNFYQEQCKDLSTKFSTASLVSYNTYIDLTVILVICVNI